MTGRDPLGPREAIWRETLASGSAAERSDAALRLGRMLRGCGEAAEGEELLREALSGGDPRIAPAAAWALAEALLADGRGPEAAEYLTLAAASADPKLSPDVVLALGARCAAVGQTDAAISLYRELLRQANGAHREQVALGCFRLAEILREREEVEEARSLLSHAFLKGAASLRPHAAIVLAELCANRGPADLVENLLEYVIDSEHADLAPRAGYELARLRHDAGEEVEAVRLLRAVALSAHPMYASMAEEELLGLISTLDVSEAVEDLVDDVLGDGQLQFQQAIRRYRVAKGVWIGARPRATCVAPYSYVVVTIRSSGERKPTPCAPLLLEAGDPVPSS